MIGEIIHYTDKTGWNAIRSQPVWTFLAQQPRADYNPVGAYFTTYRPETPDLSAKTYVPRRKLKYAFFFEDVGDLLALPGGRGRLQTIFYSPHDYEVDSERQIDHGATGL